MSTQENVGSDGTSEGGGDVIGPAGAQCLEAAPGQARGVADLHLGGLDYSADPFGALDQSKPSEALLKQSYCHPPRG
jgi:hypothetical protein